MKSAIKRMLCLGLCFLFVTPAFSIVDDDTVKITYLQNHGFPIGFLETLDSNEISEIYDGVKNDTIRYGGTTTAYLDESGNIVPNGAIDSSDLSLGMTHLLNGNATPDGNFKIESVGIYVNYE